MGCLDPDNSGRSWLRGASERTTAALLRVLNRPSFLGDKIVKRTTLQMLAKADDRTLDEFGLTRFELETLIRVTAASKAGWRRRPHQDKPLHDLTPRVGQDNLSKNAASVAALLRGQDA